MHISQLLLAQGIISAEQLDKASSHLKSDSGRFTDQLVELGLSSAVGDVRKREQPQPGRQRTAADRAHDRHARRRKRMDRRGEQ